PASPLSHDPDKVVPNKLIDALESTGKPPKTIAVVTSKFPSVHFISLGARDVAATRGLKVVLFLEYEFGNRDFAPIAARIKEADPSFLGMGSGVPDSILPLAAPPPTANTPRGHSLPSPPPGPLLAPPASPSPSPSPPCGPPPPMTANKDAELLSKLFE